MNQADALKIVSDSISQCRLCKDLYEYREKNNYKTVSGSGHPNARIMIIAESPGEHEALSGEPFVGRSGKLLNSLITITGWRRENLFITNMIACRPPENRDPTQNEVANCAPFLNLKIKIIQPEYILCLGKVAALNLLKPQTIDEKYWFSKSLASMRNYFHYYKDIKTVVTYHPSYLLRNPSSENFFLQDAKMIVNDMQKKNQFSSL